MRLMEYMVWRLAIAAMNIFLADRVYRVYWACHASKRRHRIIWPVVIALCLLAAVPALKPHYIHTTYVAMFLLSFLYEMRGPYHLLGLSLTILAMSVAETLVVAVLMLTSFVSTISHLTVIETDYPLLFHCLLAACKLLTIPLVRLMAILRKGRLLPNDFRLSLLSLACPAFSFLFVVTANYLRPYINTVLMSALDIALSWLIFFSNILFINLIDRAAQTQASQKEQELAHEALERESAHYQQILRRHSETARAMHDIRNQLTVGVGLLHEGQVETAYELLEKAYCAAGAPAGGRVTGHAAIDAILDSMQAQMKELGIRLINNVTLPQVCTVAHEDLGVAMGNLLENAIGICGAISPEKKRYISLTVKQYQDYLCIKMATPIPSPLPGVEGDFPPIHGLGLKTLRLLAEKYDGNVQPQREADACSVTVLLRNEAGRNT